MTELEDQVPMGLANPVVFQPTFRKMNKQRFPHVLSKLTMEPPRAAKTITVFVNGDPHHSGKKFIVNTKRTPTFDSLLGDVTTGVNAPFGAVRNLYTPVGGTRVLDLDALGSGKQYVAGGIKKFKKVEYGRSPRRAKSQDPRSYRHREEKSIPATSRFQNINDQHMKNITVYANGNPRVNFRFLLKSPRSQKLDYILDDVAVKISAKTGYAIRNLFAMSGEKITDAAQIRDGESYVAAGVEKFKRAAYGMSSATSQERPGRVRSRPLKPLKAPVKSQKETKEISGLKKPTKVQRKEALPPIAVAPVQKEPSDVVPDAPDIKTDLPIDQQVTEEVKEEIAELRSSSFAPQEEEEEKQEEEVVDEVKVDESADVDKFVGELVSEAVQKAKDEEQEKTEEIIEKTEDAQESETAQVEETSGETKQETVDKPVNEINEDNKETKQEIPEEKAEEIPVLEEKIDPEDQIEIVSSSAEIENGKLNDEKVEEGKVEEVVEEKDDGENNLEEIKKIETKEFPEIETAIFDLQESQDNSAGKSPSPAPEEQKEASIPEPKEDSPEIPLTVIPDPEEKTAIEEAVKALSRPSEEAETAQVEDEKVDEILEETDLVKQAISSAVEAINSEPASSTEVEQNDEEQKVEESYQGSDPKELEDAIIKESIKEGVAALNKTDDSGAAGLSETSAENVEVVEPSEVELPASEVEESKEQTIDKKKNETSLLKDEGISDHFTSEKAAAAPSGEH